MIAERILVIDDEPNMVRLCQRTLEKQGFEVEAALSGEEGLQLLKGQSPERSRRVEGGDFDLTLLDVRLPDRDGLDVLSTIQEMDPEMAVVIITSHGTMEVAIRALKSGAQDFLLKPFTPEELVTSVQEVLEKKRLIQENLRLKARLPILEISKALMSEVNLERLTQLALETVRHTLGAGRVSLMLLDEEQQELSISAALGLPEEVVTTTRVQVGQGLAGLAMQRRKPILLPEQAEDDPVIQALLTRSGIGPAICLPLMLKDRVLGVLNVSRPLGGVLSSSKGGAPFRQDDVDLLSILGGQIAVAIENARLFEQAQEEIDERKRAEEVLHRQLEELTVLHAVSTTVAEATDEHVLIEHAVQVIGKIFYPDDFGVLLLDEAAGVLRVHPSYRRREEVKVTTIALGHGIVGQVAADGQRRRIPDVTDGKWTMDNREWGLATDPLTRSALCVPLKTGTQVIGVINAESTRRDAFSEADERLLTTFAGQLAIAIEKVRLMETLEQRVADRTRELTALYDVTAVASESLELRTTLERSLERSLAAMNSRGGVIQLLDEAGETLRSAAQQGIPSHIKALIDTLSAGGSAWSSWVIEHGEPLLVPDLATDPRTPQATRASVPFSYVGVPMRTRGKVIGVLSVFGEAGQQFNVEEVALLASIADHVGVAVENARLHQQAERAVVIEERERLARELHDSVTQSLYSLTLFAEAGRELAGAGELETVKHHLVRIGETAQQALREMRLMVYELRPSALEREGLIGALHQRLDAVERRAGVEARLLAEELIELPAPVEEGLYRIAQEALNNALKHAAATSVTVHIRPAGERVELEVVDNGIGFDLEAVSDRGGMGLVSMRERAERLGGSLTILSAPGGGTRVEVSVRTQTHGSS